LVSTFRKQANKRKVGLNGDAACDARTEGALREKPSRLARIRS
jgi:hypothetical protein